MVDIQLTEMPSETVALVRRVVPMEGLTTFFGEALERVAGAVPEAGGAIAGPAFGWYHGMPGETVDVAAGFPVSGDIYSPDGGVVVAERPGGQALVAMHVGSYDGLGQTWDETAAPGRGGRPGRARGRVGGVPQRPHRGPRDVAHPPRHAAALSGRSRVQPNHPDAGRLTVGGAAPWRRRAR